MTTASSVPAGVMAMACMQMEIECNTGSPNGERRDSQQALREEQARPYGVAERPVVVMKLGNAGGAKGPQFKVNVSSGTGPGDWR